MNFSPKNYDQAIVRLQKELKRKKREIMIKEEEFAAEKLEILREIAAIKRQDSNKSDWDQSAAKDALTDSQKIHDLQTQLKHLSTIIQEKKTEERQFDGLIKAKSEAFEEIKAKIRDKSLSPPRKENYDFLQQKIRELELDARKLRIELEHKNRRVTSLKEQAKRIRLGIALQAQFRTGDFATSVPPEIVDFCKAKLQVAKRLWLDARNSYPTNVLKYLEYGISAFLCSIDMYYAALSLQIPKKARNLDDFTERVQVLSKANIRIRTSIAESLIGILIKMERGIDVVPQPSFVNEIREFLDEMAELFNLEGGDF